MRKLLQKLPFPVEFAIVVVGAFGLAIVSGALSQLHIRFSLGAADAFFGYWRTVAIDVVALAVLSLFLKARGWTGARLGLESHWTDGLWGLGLAAGVYYVSYLTLQLLHVIVPGMAQAAAAQAAALPPKLPLVLVVAIILIPSFFQEFFVSGYVITVLKEKGQPELAVNVSVALRLLCYLYLGLLSLVLIIPLALIFSIWFERTGRLWPVIVAHTIISMVTFAPYLHG